MKRKVLILIAIVAATMLVATDMSALGRSGIKADSVFNNRMAMIGWRFYNLHGISATPQEQEALRFLYSYMPLADVTDYPTSFFLDNVRTALQAKSEMEWGKRVDSRLFRHFVLPVRVNNEALDSSRMVFYRELKHRVRGMSMYDAILEVNHWCHEHVTYQPSDARTSSPLATIKTATGRCGEESTLLVAALRSVGIPARQVYTPRWAHTDDNHAWVEAWADGTWHFLGACEPEPVLNLAWFNAPASRAMLMHTRVFGDYDGPEEVLLRTSNFTEINLTSGYAPTSTLGFSVVNANGKPVANARVDFKIYNYAEFSTCVTKYTDHNGYVDLSAGRGDMMVWASKDGWYGYEMVNFGKAKTVTLRLSRNAITDNKIVNVQQQHYDVMPPVENASVPEVTEAMVSANKVRLAYEDSLRKAYMSTFYTIDRATKEWPNAAELMVKARGNHQTIAGFLTRHKDNEERALRILHTLTDKDLRDITPQVLDDVFASDGGQLCPRVESEMITRPFMCELARVFSPDTVGMFRRDPQLLAQWIADNIRLYPDTKALKIAQTPIGVLQSRITDTRSRDIFFVDVARSLGIEARKDVVTGKVQYMKDGAWHDISFASVVSKQPRQGTLVMTYSPVKYLDDPKYYSHFTLSKIVDGVPRLLNLDNAPLGFEDGVSWSNSFKDGYKLDEGTYIMVTGSRMASGKVLANVKYFNITAGKTTALSLDMRHSDVEVGVIGSFNSESPFDRDGRQVSLLSQTGRGYYVLGVIGVGQEPTNHTLHDIERMKDDFEQWGRPVVLLAENEGALKNFNRDEFDALPSSVIMGVDTGGAIRRQIVSEMKLKQANQLPIFIIADTFNRVIFLSQGYTKSLGEQLNKVIKQL